MLKIKDNVDLKELEKYGFIFEKTYIYYRINNSEVIEIRVDEASKYNRIIRLYIDDSYFCCFTSRISFDLLYDLIKDGLVERV